MAATIGKVSAVFTASTSGLKAGVQDASASFKKLAGDVSGLRSGLRTLAAIQGAQLFGQVASAASSAARSFVNMAKGEAETIDKTSKLSRRLGLTYGELAGLGLAGDLAGVSMETIGKAATKADVAFVKAAQGSSLAQKALAGVGLSVDDLQNKTPAERFQMMADAIAGLPSPAERARAAIGLFGKSGADLLPLFEGGAGSIRKAVDEANKFGLALTDEQGVSVENMNDAFTRAYASIQGVVQQVVAYLAPAVQSVADTFTNLIGNIGGASIGQFIGDGIIAGAEFLATIADSFIASLSSAWEFVSSVGVQWASVFDLGQRTAAFLSGVGNAFKVVLAAGIVGLTAPVTALLKGADFLAKRVGVDLGVHNFIKGADAFNESLFQSMTDGGKAAGEDFKRAFGEGGPAATTQRGPVSSTLADALKAARENAAATNEATRSKVKPDKIQEALFTGPSTEALKATDSRSKEGVAEMLRLMRGGSQDVQERQLEVLERIHEDLSEGDSEEIAEFAGA
jgi:hypothetical protein